MGEDRPCFGVFSLCTEISKRTSTIVRKILQEKKITQIIGK